MQLGGQPDRSPFLASCPAASHMHVFVLPFNHDLSNRRAQPLRKHKSCRATGDSDGFISFCAHFPRPPAMSNRRAAAALCTPTHALACFVLHICLFVLHANSRDEGTRTGALIDCSLITQCVAEGMADKLLARFITCCTLYILA